MNHNWKVTSLSLGTTFAVAYVLCAIFDAVFPPFGLLTALAPASPWPVGGSLLGFAAGLATSAVAGLALGALYGAACGFWGKRVR